MASKILILTRHAKARERDFVTKDIERPLRAKGVHQALSIGLQLRSLNLLPQKMVSSPSTRTIETARYILAQMPNKTKIDIEQNLYEAYTEQIIESIQCLDDEVHIALYTLHNPSITDLVYTLDRSEERITHLRCGETVIIEIEGAWNAFNVYEDYKMKLIKP